MEDATAICPRCGSRTERQGIMDAVNPTESMWVMKCTNQQCGYREPEQHQKEAPCECGECWD